MFSEEWPLMMFTLVSQLAIGSFIILVIVRSLLAKKDAPTAKNLTSFGFLAVGPLMALALILSIFHLGTPMGAYQAIANLGSSWLSREILTAGVFLVLWIVSYRTYMNVDAGNALGWITSLVGLAAIYSMSSIYANSIRPAWANANTFIAFFGATFALGSLGAASLIVYGAKGKNLTAEAVALLKKVSILGGLAVILPLIYLPVFISGLGGGMDAAQASAKLLSSTYAFPLIATGLLCLAAAALLFFGLSKKAESKTTIAPNLVYLALVLVLVGEFIGRYVFYASAVSIMVGMN